MSIVKQVQSAAKAKLERDRQLRESAAERAMEARWVEVMPARYASYGLIGHPDGQAAAAAMRWIDEEPYLEDVGSNLIITGAVGVGKTGLAAATLKTVHWQGALVEYANVPEFFGRILGYNFAAKRAEILRLQEADVLLLDDLGAEKATEWSASVIYEVVEYRYRSGAPTIVTTNLAKPELREAVGDRVVSRLFEKAHLLVLPGGDRRRAK